MVNWALVVVIAGIVLTGYLVVSSDDGCGCKTTVQFRSPEISIRQSGEDIIWDATIHINKMTPKDEDIPWAKVKVSLKASDGSILNERTNLHRYDPSAVTDGGTDSADVQFWFEDSIWKPKVGAGDNIVVTGMNDEQYEGALVQLLYEEKIIGDTTLPTDFP